MGKKIYARFLYANGTTFKPNHKIWIGTNHKLKISGTDHGIWRRIRLIPFNHTIEKPDKDFMDKLKSESSGIFNWLVEGVKEYLNTNLNEPQAVIDAINEYKSEMDLIQDFLTNCTVQGVGKMVGATILYNSYKNYTTQSGDELLKQKQFGKCMSGKGFSRKRKGQGLYYIGLDIA